MFHAASTGMSFNMLRLVVISLIVVCILANPLPEGHRLPERGIIGGSYAKTDQFPYQLSLQHKKNHICGAALVSKKVAVTAAHCTKNTNPKFLTVVADTINRNAEGVRIHVDRSEEHNKFNPVTNDYDIAVVLLKASFTLGSGINIIALPKANEVIPPGAYATVSGWGVDQATGDDTGVNTKYLKFVQTPIWRDVRCYKVHRMVAEVYCGGIDSGLENPCAGDSGSPLVYKNKLFGVVAFGYGCGTPNEPAVYTNVAAYRNWIIRKGNLNYT